MRDDHKEKLRKTAIKIQFFYFSFMVDSRIQVSESRLGTGMKRRVVSYLPSPMLIKAGNITYISSFLVPQPGTLRRGFHGN